MVTAEQCERVQAEHRADLERIREDLQAGTRQFGEVGKQLAEVVVLLRRSDELYRAVYVGNGKPPLMERVAALERACQEWAVREDRAASRAEGRWAVWVRTWGAALIALATTVVMGGIAIWAALHG